MNKKIIALAGGTGDLGKLVANELMTMPDVQLRLLVRPASRPKIADLEVQGAEVIEGEIGGDAAPLEAFVNGATSVVSTLQGGPDIIIDGQMQLLKAARAAGVRRFIPSDFSIDMFHVPQGQVMTIDMRRNFADLADMERGEVEVVHVLNGGFLDKDVLFNFINVINVEEQTAYTWGDSDEPTYWTTYADTARFTAAAAIDDRPLPKAFTIAGDVRTFKELVADYEAVTSRTLKVIRLGSFEDLDVRIAELVQTGPQENFIKYLPLMYHRAILKGQGKPERLLNNFYPAIPLTTFKDYVQQEGL